MAASEQITCSNVLNVLCIVHNRKCLNHWMHPFCLLAEFTAGRVTSNLPNPYKLKST